MDEHALFLPPRTIASQLYCIANSIQGNTIFKYLIWFDISLWITECNKNGTMHNMTYHLLLHMYPSRRNFFVFTKITYLQPFRKIMKGQTKRQFSAKTDAAGQKMTFQIFFFCCTSSRQDETFLFLPKFQIFNGSEIS